MILPVPARSSGARKLLEGRRRGRRNFPSAIASLLCGLQKIADELVCGLRLLRKIAQRRRFVQQIFVTG